MKLSAKIEGVNKAINALQDKSEDIQARADQAIGESAKMIETKAKQNTPVGADGRLRASISAEKDRDLNWAVIVNSRYAPYVEFGTKSKVSVPSGLEGYAMQFKGGGGSFDELVKSIRNWAKKKGIPEDAVYPISISITREGVSAQPFLFPAFEAERKRLLKDLKKVLNGS